MQLCRLIAPPWLLEQDSSISRIMEGLFSKPQIKKYNNLGYNVYYFPNYPKNYNPNKHVDSKDIDTFEWVFVDCDLKDGVYADKEDFVATLSEKNILPTKIIYSGHGVHAYWKISNLDAISFLRFQKRLIRLFDTDKSVCTLHQLMRLPNTWNTKVKQARLVCEPVHESGLEYTAEDFDRLLPVIAMSDEKDVQLRYNSAYGIQNISEIKEELPEKFGKLLRENIEIKKLYVNDSADRSKNDFRLAHLLFANEFTREEALSVLYNTAKAVERNPSNQRKYAENIVNKIWVYELNEESEKLDLHLSVRELLKKGEDTVKGARFPCHPRIDNTAYGLRLGQVLGLVAGSGVGKTAFALNMFKWFAQRNPEYHHFFIPLEQPAGEIAERWSSMCKNDTSLHEKVQIMSNYDEDNNFRNLSLCNIEDYIKKYTKVTGHKVGCVVIDHIGVLKKKDRNGNTLELEQICHSMKKFAVETNTFLVMQSQTNREKAGIGDLELNKDAAYGTVFFESFVDYLVTLWQPVKRCHSDPACPSVTAYKFCKIRHKKVKKDIIQEDVPYYLAFDSETEQLKDMTGDQKKSFEYFLVTATNKRKEDRKTEILTYKSVPHAETENIKNN